MIDWKGEDLSPEKDGSIERFVITAGKGFTTPADASLVNGEIIYKSISSSNLTLITTTFFFYPWIHSSLDWQVQRPGI